MNFDFSRYELEGLKALYKKESDELKTRLLNGALWEDVKDQRLTVKELSMALYQKIQSIQGANPAEFSLSDIEGR